MLFARLWIHRSINHKADTKLFTFLSVDMEILTPWSSQVHPEAKYRLLKGVKISI
jgi:hypothetical protein